MTTRTTETRSALPAGMRREAFGTTPEGEPVDRYTLSSTAGVALDVLTWGGVIQSIRMPDRRGAVADVALGYDSLDQYRADKSYFGSIVGRYANRIRGGRFTLDGREHALETNAGNNHLHGGRRGFSKAVWSAEPFEHGGDIGLVLTHVSPDGDERYPGE